MTSARNSARRAIALLFVLQGHAIDGLRLNQIAEAMQTSTPTTLRDLQMLADEGIAERLPGHDKQWRLTPRIVQIAFAHEQEIARAEQQLGEFNQRYTRSPN